MVCLYDLLLFAIFCEIEQILNDRVQQSYVLLLFITHCLHSIENRCKDPFKMIVKYRFKQESLLVSNYVLQDYFRVEKEVQIGILLQSLSLLLCHLLYLIKVSPQKGNTVYLLVQSGKDDFAQFYEILSWFGGEDIVVPKMCGDA